MRPKAAAMDGRTWGPPADLQGLKFGFRKDKVGAEILEKLDINFAFVYGKEAHGAINSIQVEVENFENGIWVRG